MTWRNPKRTNKLGAIKTTVDGITFHSAGEARRYSTLKLLEHAGEISELELQPKFPLGTDDKPVLIRSKGYPNGRRAAYIADFAYRDKCGAKITEDFKGFFTSESKLKIAMVEAQYGIRIIITGARTSSPTKKRQPKCPIS